MDWICKRWICKTWICKTWICKRWICKRWICKRWICFKRLLSRLATPLKSLFTCQVDGMLVRKVTPPPPPPPQHYDRQHPIMHLGEEKQCGIRKRHDRRDQARPTDLQIGSRSNGANHSPPPVSIYGSHIFLYPPQNKGS